MITKHLQPKRSLSLALVVAVSLALPVGTLAGSSGASTSDTSTREARAVALQEMAHAEGALGVFFDETARRFVVVVPEAGSTFTLTDASWRGLPVRIEKRGIDQATIDRIESLLEGLKPTVGGSYGFGFDPKSGTVTLTADAPEADFAAVEAQFPGKISYRPGWFQETSWDNDTAPYSGGAFLDGQKLCTSGFSIDFNSGGRAMVTAGHCNDNGLSTNMGTAVREAAAYPYWDFELISGRTYRGFIYDTGSTTRPVINAWNPSVGSSYCTTGRTSGFRCGWTLRKLDQTICYYDINICVHNLAEFYNSNGDVVQPGDSGGPLWYNSSSPFGAGIRGVISGRSWDLFQGWSSYATEYQVIANYYVGHATLGS